MSLENKIEEESSITLPYPINLEEAKKFLFYIAIELPANMLYTVSYSINLTHMKPSGGIKDYEGTVKINGTIQPFKPDFSSDSFTLEPDVYKDSSKMKRIKFETIPGYIDLSDYGSEIINLWREVRRLTNEYFVLKHV